MIFNLSTLKLLTGSILVGISGVFKLHIAFLLLGIAPDLKTYLACFLIIYATYTLDRAMDNEEDKINRKELDSSRKDIAIGFCFVSFIAGSLLLSLKGLLFMAFLPIIIGYIYSKGICIGSRKLKLKGNFGMKNLTVSLTWGSFISGIAQGMTNSTIVLLFIFPFFTVKSFINTVIYDFRDVKGDAIAGIKTLPICLGEIATRRLLQVMHILLHLWIAASMLLRFVMVEMVLFVVSCFAGLMYTWFLTRPSLQNETRSRKIMRDVLVDGEFILAVFIRTIIRF
jgi:4-hydroxybenzoate polyprenyltransferase